jgi:chromosome segregation ATPase
MSDDELWRLRSVEADLHSTLDELADLEIRHHDLKEKLDDVTEQLERANNNNQRLLESNRSYDEECTQLRRQLTEAEHSIQHYERIDRMKDQNFVVTGDFVDTTPPVAGNYVVEYEGFWDDFWDDLKADAKEDIRKKAKAYGGYQRKDAQFKGWR